MKSQVKCVANHIGKRFFDLVTGIIIIILLLPLLILIALIIKLNSKGPVLFKQKRFGIHKSYFYIYKYRTMHQGTPQDIPTHLLEDPERFITPIGVFLRKSSLDELPQILNVLRGEMSFVGPRPALWNQYDLIEERDKYNANDVLPGITGWAQINGRDELDIPLKASLDGEYIKKWSFLFDMKILLLTFGKVIQCEGYVEGMMSKTVHHRSK